MDHDKINELLADLYTKKGQRQWWAAYEAADEARRTKMTEWLERGGADDSYY